MTALADFYVAQPFWIWLAVGVLLLAVEAMFSTEWLLWPAGSAGGVAVMTAAG
ncbi:NfeD family protein, partial [Halomonas sp. ND22Bw]